MNEPLSETSATDTRPLLVAADWQSRALLLAELQERGIEVRTEAGVRWATRALMHERLAPPLLLLDTTSDPDATPDKVERLLAILAEDGVHPTLLFLVSVFGLAEWQEPFGNRATILTRPRTVNEVATLVQALLRQQ
ncbi:MAG TPA: hypothetical protein VF707_17625 [Ardenticatenaceae bacterium]|jgi:hypothetical protein